MTKLATPFGEIDVLIDGESVPYTAQEGGKLDVLCPDVLGRYQIDLQYAPDGREHSIACVFTSNRPYEREHESGERLECQSFYSDDRFKMSIRLECDAGYWPNGKRASDEYDYDAYYLDNGMSFLILPNTKTEQYVFGICWIDNVGWEDPIDYRDSRGVQTWYGADPLLSL